MSFELSSCLISFFTLPLVTVSLPLLAELRLFLRGLPRVGGLLDDGSELTRLSCKYSSDLLDRDRLTAGLGASD